MYAKSDMETYITICKIDSQREFAVCLRKLEQGLWINLERWNRREVQNGGDICIPTAVFHGVAESDMTDRLNWWLIHVEVRQKTTKFCKIIILQEKNKRKKKYLGILLKGRFWVRRSERSLRFHIPNKPPDAAGEGTTLWAARSANSTVETLPK